MPRRRPIEGTVREISEIFLEMRHASDRVAAIACAAVLDDALRATIYNRLIILGKDWEDRLFGDQSAPLGTFYSKILLAYAMGLIGPTARADLSLIRSMRNDFAHTGRPITFDEPIISQKCNRISDRRKLEDFNYPDWIMERVEHVKVSSRNRFIGACEWIAADLSATRPRRLRTIYPAVLR